MTHPRIKHRQRKPRKAIHWPALASLDHVGPHDRIPFRIGCCVGEQIAIQDRIAQLAAYGDAT